MKAQPRTKPNQAYARARVNRSLNVSKRVNRPVIQRGGTKI